MFDALFQKRITVELREKGDKPATPEDVLAFLDKHFDSKLSAVERDELQLDKGILHLNCFSFFIGILQINTYKHWTRNTFKKYIWENNSNKSLNFAHKKSINYFNG